MSVENVKKFYEVLSQDKAMQQKFIDLNQKYQGQQMDEEKAMAVMGQEALPIAAQMGYSFSMDDLKAYGEEMKQAKINCELSDSELEAVTGGGLVGVYCFVAGVNYEGLFMHPFFCICAGTGGN